MTAIEAVGGATHTVGDVAQESGVAASAVRFYERNGVITALRTPGNQRRFDESAGCKIKVARLAQRVGLTVREIAEVFADFPVIPTPDDWNRISDTLVAEAEARTAALHAQLRKLRSGAMLCELAPFD